MKCSFHPYLATLERWVYHSFGTNGFSLVDLGESLADEQLNFMKEIMVKICKSESDLLNMTQHVSFKD